MHTLASWQIFAHITYRDRTPATWRLLPPQVQSRRRPRLKRILPVPSAIRGAYIGPGFVLATWGAVMGQVEHHTQRRPEWVLGLEPHRGRAGLVLHAHALVMLPGMRQSPRAAEEQQLRELVWREGFQRCGRTLVEPYSGAHDALYAGKYVAKGGALHFSTGLRPLGGPGGASLELIS